MSSYTDLCFHSLFIFLFLLESIKKELSLVILKLHLVDLLFRRWPRVPLPYYWYGYERDFSGHPRAKSGHLRAKSSTLTNNPRDQETQVAGSKALLTILARVKEEKPHVRFTKEFVLVLLLNHSLCNLGCTHSIQIDEEEQVARGKAILASARELEAELFGEMQTVGG